MMTIPGVQRRIGTSNPSGRDVIRKPLEEQAAGEAHELEAEGAGRECDREPEEDLDEGLHGVAALRDRHAKSGDDDRRDADGFGDWAGEGLDEALQRTHRANPR